MKRVNCTDNDGLNRGTWFDLDEVEMIAGATYYDGSNWVSKSTGSMFESECLYVTKRAWYILSKYSSDARRRTIYLAITEDDAKFWLLENGHFEYIEQKFPEYLDIYEI